jgi:hypothetical protein
MNKVLNFKLICFDSTPYSERVKIAEELLIQYCDKDKRYDSIMSDFIREPSENHLNEIRIYMVSVHGQLDYQQTLKIMHSLVEGKIVSQEYALEIISSLPNVGSEDESDIKEEASELLELIREGFATRDSLSDFFQNLSKSK